MVNVGALLHEDFQFRYVKGQEQFLNVVAGFCSYAVSSWSRRDSSIELVTFKLMVMGWCLPRFCQSVDTVCKLKSHPCELSSALIMYRTTVLCGCITV